MNPRLIPSPYLSVVATSRNDDHGGSLLRRMQLFVSGFIEQCKRHNLNAELILVEWNPPPDRPRLIDALQWPQDLGPCQVRIVEVPYELHCRFQYSDRLPLFQMIAKNVGIRRARGKFVLATNIDILFSDELIQFLAKHNLKSGVMYRIDRYDVSPHIPDDAPIAAQLEFCQNNLIRICLRDGTPNLITGETTVIYPPRSEPPIVFPIKQPFRKLLPKRLRKMALFRPRKLTFPYIKGGHLILNLHTNACGDFTLLSKECWFRLLGYPELEMFSMHIDTLLLIMAFYDGAKEIVLKDPMRIYHIEHNSGWTPEVERDQSLNNRLKSIGLPQMSGEQLDEWALWMHKEGRALVFNSEDWGMAKDQLPEVSIVGSRMS